MEDRDARLTQLATEMAWLRRLSRALLGGDGDDLAHETWIVAADRAPPDRPLRPWLHRVARNLSRMQARGRKRREAREAAAEQLVEPVPAPDALVQRVELQRDVAGKVLGLDEPYRSTVLMRYFEDLSCAEIARRLGVPEGTVRRRLKVALDRLRARFDDASDGKRRGLAVLVPLAGLPPPRTSISAGVLGVLAMKKLVAAIALLVVLVLAVVLWHRHTRGDARSTDAGSPLAAVANRRTASIDRAAKPPSWFAVRGAPARQIAGRVTYDGKPIANASVTLHSTLTRAGVATVVQRRTAPDGTFDLGTHPPALYQVVAAAPGHTAAIASIELADPTLRPPSDKLELVLGACGASVAGTIVDASGGPIAHAHVRREGLVGVDADERGAYRLCLPRGDNEVTFVADGYGAVVITVDAPGHVRRDVVLVPEGVVGGRVVDAHDRPVGDMLVIASPKPWGRDRFADASVLSDRDGRFRIAGLGPGRYLFAAYGDGRFAEGVDVFVEVGGANAEVVLRTSELARVRGTVTMQGRPVAGARVVATQVPAARRSTVGISQADGSFVLERVPLGELAFSAAPFAVESGATRTIETAREIDGVALEVSALATVRGRVTHGGRGVPGAIVCCVPVGASHLDRHVADHDGNFEVQGVLPGTHRVMAQHDELGAFTEGTEITVAAGEDRRLDLELDLEASIAGTVVDQHGKPVAGVFVRWTHERTGDLGKTITDEQGRYRCMSMTGGGQYRAAVYASAALQSLYAPAGGPHPTVELANGKSHVDGIRLAIDRQDHAITGRVVDRDGDPIVDAQVRALAAQPGQPPVFHSWLKIPHTVTDAEGQFSITGLTAGNHAVWAKAGDGGEGTVANVAAGASGVVVTVDRPGSIAGVLRGFPSTPNISASALGDSRVVVEAASANTSAFRVVGLRPGRYLVNAQTLREGGAAIVEVRPGETTRVAIAARGRAAIEGHVLDFRTRAPIPRADCHVIPSVDGMHGVTAWDMRIAPRSDERGRVVIDPAPAGEVVVRCFPGSRRWSNPSAAVSVQAGGRATVQLLGVELRGDPSSIGIDFDGRTPTPRIAVVKPGTPAAAAGLLAGDLIVAVDGAAIDGLNWAGVHHLINSHPVGSEVTLVVRRGDDTRTVKLKPQAPRYE